jgi:mono/diheme cytochrome c family protein
MNNTKYYLFLVLLSGLFTVAKANAFPWNFDMWIQPSILPYEEPVAYPQLSVTTHGLRIKPLPREDFENITTNPVPATPESLAHGEKLFNRYCFVCHGMEGKGDGPVIKRGFYPMNLTSPAVIARTNGYIYAYIRYGGKVMMPSYRESISSQGAWNVVNYVRKLQGNPKTEPEKPQENTVQENTQEDGSTN